MKIFVVCKVYWFYELLVSVWRLFDAKFELVNFDCEDIDVSATI